MPGHRYVEEISLAAMLAAKRSAGVAPELKLKGACNKPSTKKTAHSGFETQRRCHRDISKMTYVL